MNSSSKPSYARRRAGTAGQRSFIIYAVAIIALGAGALSLRWAAASAAREGSAAHASEVRGARVGANAAASLWVAPVLGNYPNATVGLSGDVTVTPDAAPVDATGINVSTSTDFKGTFAADPTTGVVRVTNAHPAGTYTVTVRAFDSGGASDTKIFQLTVQAGTACAGDSVFTGTTDVSVGFGPLLVAVGDFNNDGKQDIAAANLFSDTVSIRLGDGSGALAARRMSLLALVLLPWRWEISITTASRILLLQTKAQTASRSD